MTPVIGPLNSSKIQGVALAKSLLLLRHNSIQIEHKIYNTTHIYIPSTT